MKRQYQTVNIPSDAESDPDRRFELAIQNNTFRNWVIPCIWRLVWDDGENVRICRVSENVASHPLPYVKL